MCVLIWYICWRNIYGNTYWKIDAVPRNTKGYEIVQRAIGIAILFQYACSYGLWRAYIWCGYEYRYGDEYKYGDDCLIAYIRQIICYCFY